MNNRLSYCIVLTVLFGFFLNQVVAQQVLEGNVYDENNKPLPYASVFLGKLGIGSISDFNGHFSIEIPFVKSTEKLDTLVVSYVGYEASRNPIFLGDQKTILLDIELLPKLNLLKELNVIASKTPSPEIIVKTAIKNVKRNYSSQELMFEGFYSELVKENDKWIKLNESKIQLNYSAYPQKGFIKKAFRQYYSMEWGSSSASDVFRHLIFFPSYISPKDQVEVEKLRISKNNSKYGLRASPVGGPMDLIALDKVKYGYDFLDSRLLDKYVYEIKGRKKIENELCYVISFHPKNQVDAFYQRFDKKMQYALYIGQLYVTVKDYSVVGFNAQLSRNTNFGSQANQIFIPEFLKYSVKYKKVENRFWVLNSVSTEQRSSRRIGSLIVPYICKRSLQLFKTIQKENNSINKDEIFLLTQNASLKNRYLKYDSVFWNQFVKSTNYIAPKPETIKDLEMNTPLRVQFQHANLPIDSIESPVPSEYISVTQEILDMKTDSLALYNNMRTKEMNLYLHEENRYFSDVLNRLGGLKRKFSYQYFRMIISDSNEYQEVFSKGHKFVWEQDSLGFLMLYQKSETNKRKILNYSFASKGKKNFHIENLQFNNENILAYTYSEKGNITNTLILKQFGSDIILDSLLTVNEFLWFSDSIILVTRTDSSDRSNVLMAYYLDRMEDKCEDIYTESDKKFSLEIDTSNSGQFTFLISSSLDEKEYFSIVNNNGKIEMKLIEKRNPGYDFVLNHFYQDNLYIIRTSIIGESVLSVQSVRDQFHGKWKPLYLTNNTIEDIYETKNYIAIKEYKVDNLVLKIFDKSTNFVTRYNFTDEISAFDFVHYEDGFMKNQIEVDYSSPKTANQLLIISLEDQSYRVAESDSLNPEIFGNNYVSELVWVQSNDGTKIPVTLFYDANKISQSPKGLIIKAYGAYGAKKYPFFSAEDVIYANDSFIVAFAHVRGGGELGRQWYVDGKLLNKLHSFEDYIACVDYLQENFEIPSQRTIGIASSAGGLIMGYAANKYPHLFGALIFDKPYLDVLNTMKDDRLPLTTAEYLEWGNPSDSAFYNYIKAYSPYQNIQPQKYPNMLFFIKFYDEQTPCWQIMQSVAKYRSSNQSKNIIMAHTDFNSGHRGSVNFSMYVEEMAFKYAFVNYVVDKKVK